VGLGAQDEWRGEPLVEQAGGIEGSDTEVAGEPRQDGIGLGQGVAGERDLAAAPPVDDGCVLAVRLDE
jgi:hypothetical protein